MTPDSFVEPELSGDEKTLILSGIVTHHNVKKVWQRGLDKIKNMVNPFSIDLGGLTQCDSSGLAICTAWSRAAYQQQKKVEFINVPVFLKGLFRVYGLETVLM